MNTSLNEALSTHVKQVKQLQAAASSTLSEIDKIRTNGAGFRLRENDLGLIINGPSINPPVNWAAEDIFSPYGVYNLNYIDDQKKGDLLPVYLNEWQLRNIRLRSRRTCFFNEFAICAIENRVNYVVGEGFSYVVNPVDEQNKEHKQAAKLAQNIVDLFLEVNDMPELEADTMRKLDIDGEAFIRLFPDSKGICHARFVKPEHVRSMLGGDSQAEYSYGIITNPNDVETIRAFCVVENPLVTGWTPTPVDADEIVHIKNTTREAKRGCPKYFSVLPNLDRAEDLLSSMTHLAKVRAKLALIRKVTGASSEAADKLLAALSVATARYENIGKDLNIELMTPGSIATIPGNVEIVTPDLSLGASDLVEVLQTELRGIAGIVQMPEWMFTALADAKYSNAFVVESPVLKAFLRLQGQLTKVFGSGRYRNRSSLVWRQLRMAVQVGLLPAWVLACITIECKGPSLETRDKAQEATRADTLVKGKLSSRKQQIQELGYDPEETFDQIKQETAGERRPVQDMQEIAALQAQFYSGQLPKDACVANCMIVLGYTKEHAEMLFPGEPTPQQPMPGAGSPTGDGDIQDDSGTMGDGGMGDDGTDSSDMDEQGETRQQGEQVNGGNPLAAALGIQESTDSSGHEHKGKGEGGGQFTSGGGGSSPSGEGEKGGGKAKKDAKQPTVKNEPKPDVNLYSDVRHSELSDEENSSRTDNMINVIRQMTPKAKELVNNNVTKIDSRKDMKDMSDRWIEETGQMIAEGSVAGYYDMGSGRLTIDGGTKSFTPGEIYAHELGHAIDKPGRNGPYKYSYSEDEEWKEAWREEIVPDNRISKYATTDEQEGFAEFCRLLYGMDLDHNKLTELCPKTMAFFRKHELI